MKNVLQKLIPLLCAILLAACASPPPPSPPEPLAESGAIRIQILSDPQLNSFSGNSHTLVCCIYQLSTTGKLKQLANDNESIRKLRKCDLFDSSVTQAQRFIIHPGEDMNLKIDRVEGTKYVALITGYRTLKKDRIMRIYEIPVIEEKKGWLRKTTTRKLGYLEIIVKLGSEQIVSF